MSFGPRGQLLPFLPPQLSAPERERLFEFALSLPRSRLELLAEGRAVLSAGGRTFLFRRTGLGIVVSSPCGWCIEDESMDVLLAAVRVLLGDNAPVNAEANQGHVGAG